MRLVRKYVPETMFRFQLNRFNRTNQTTTRKSNRVCHQVSINMKQNVTSGLGFHVMLRSRRQISRRKLRTYAKQLTGIDYFLQPTGLRDYTTSKPSKYDLCSSLSSCAKTLNFNLGKQMHTRVVKNGHEVNFFIGSALVDMYSSCGMVSDARKVFDESQNYDEVIWTAMMRGLAQNGFGKEVFYLFKDMLRLSAQVRPNCVTYAILAGVCGWVEFSFELGTLIHGHIVKLGFGGNFFMISGLVDCYSKCGKVDLAKLLFDATTEKDDVLVNSMISGYSRNGCGEEALRLFVEMRNCNFRSTEHTLSSVLNACGSSALLEQGKQVHSLIIKLGMERNMFEVSALINMYSKCSAMEKACQVFNEASDKNCVVWTSMVMGYAYSGQGTNALALFENMIALGFTPDHVCFTSVLVACNHAGLYERGIEYFDKMIKYGLQPELDQYACLIDLYARNGKVSRAMEIMKTMPNGPNAVILTSFLGSCKVYGEVKFGEEAARQLFGMEPHNAAHYLTLASIYSQAGLQNKVIEMRKLMSKKGIRLTVGRSWL